MIIRKPYAFFIKMFKPLHILISVLISYLVYLSNNFVSYFDTYISNPTMKTDGALNLSSNFLFILPVIIIILSLIILGIMYRKKKPYVFYFATIIIFIAAIVINIYSTSFLKTLSESIVSIKSVKLIRDLNLINIIILSMEFILYIIRGFGINFKKFDFDSDINKLKLDSTDNEEVELIVNFDIDAKKSKRKKQFRNYKYFIIENKSWIVFSFSVIASIFVFVFLYVKLTNNGVGENNLVSINGFNYEVKSTYLLDNIYGEENDNSYLVIIELRMALFDIKKNIYLNDFSLNIDDLSFKPTNLYSNYLIDIGNSYQEGILSNEYDNYIITFELPKKYIDSKMKFTYAAQGFDKKINLKPIKYNPKKTNKTIKLGESIALSDNFKDISFKINNYEISDFYKINYNYCYDNNCLNSYEYLRPSIDENFDKSILKLDIDYIYKEKRYDNFYSLFSDYGSIYYKIDDDWYFQNSNFEEIVSNKKHENNIVYIGINNEIKNSQSIKLVFNIRNSKYEYILK